MKTLFVSAVAASLLFAATAQAAAPLVLTVAVFDFESKDESVRDLGSKLATLINAQLAAQSNLILVERTELDKAIGEVELGLSGTVSPDTAAKAGHLTGAKILVTGRVFKVDKDTIAVAKIIGAETSRVYGEMARDGGDGLTALAATLAAQIAKVVADKGDTLVAHAIPREERIANLVRSLGQGPRPAVSVRLAERHFGQPTVDPAAALEWTLLLQQAGFNVVDDQSKEKPVLEMTGEAFSAFGLRKGNLISCKARLELKVHDLNARKLVLADRQTSVAVDLAEQTAAKAALQNAVLELAERVLPRLAK